MWLDSSRIWAQYWANPDWYDSRMDREAAFDRFVGDGVGHLTVPELTKEAVERRQELIRQINDRWLDRTEKVEALQQKLQGLEANKPDLATDKEHQRNLADAARLRGQAEEARKLAASGEEFRWVKDGPNGPYEVSIHPEQELKRAREMEAEARRLETRVPTIVNGDITHARQQLEAYQTEMVDAAEQEIQSVRDFESNPAHWDLTQEQRDMVTSHGEPGQTTSRPD